MNPKHSLYLSQIGVAFCCPTSHYMCNECAGTWGENMLIRNLRVSQGNSRSKILVVISLDHSVNSVMGDLETSYPPKCPLCKAAISKDSFERQLSTEQQNTFRTHAARTALKPGERLIECKECGLYEVTKDDPVLWWCPHCGCGMCRVCNKDEDLPPNAFKFDIEKSAHQGKYNNLIFCCRCTLLLTAYLLLCFLSCSLRDTS